MDADHPELDQRWDTAERPCLGGILSFAAWIYLAVTIENSPTKQGKHDEMAGGTQVVKT